MLAKEYHLIDIDGGLLPYTTEVNELIKVKYPDTTDGTLHNHIGCGMTLSPEYCMSAPTVAFEATINSNDVYSLLMIDMDIDVCLWAVYT